MMGRALKTAAEFRSIKVSQAAFICSKINKRQIMLKLYYVPSMYLFISIFSDAIMTYVHHVAEAVLQVADGQSCWPLQFTSMAVYHR